MDQSSFEKLIGSQQKSVSLFMKPADVLVPFNRSTDYIHHIYGKSFYLHDFCDSLKTFL